MKKEVIIELLKDISREIEIDLSTSEKMLENKNDDNSKERVIAYLELSLESIKRKIDKIK